MTHLVALIHTHTHAHQRALLPCKASCSKDTNDRPGLKQQPFGLWTLRGWNPSQSGRNGGGTSITAVRVFGRGRGRRLQPEGGDSSCSHAAFPEINHSVIDLSAGRPAAPLGSRPAKSDFFQLSRAPPGGARS